MMKPSIRSRRDMLLGASLLPPSSALATDAVPTPRQAEGPFYPTGFPADMENGLVQVRS